MSQEKPPKPESAVLHRFRLKGGELFTQYTNGTQELVDAQGNDLMNDMTDLVRTRDLVMQVDALKKQSAEASKQALQKDQSRKNTPPSQTPDPRINALKQAIAHHQDPAARATPTAETVILPDTTPAPKTSFLSKIKGFFNGK